jgi:hypothetical protein
MDIYDNINKGVYTADEKPLEKIAKFIICTCEAKYQIRGVYLKIPAFCPNCGRPIKEKAEEAQKSNKEIGEAYNENVAELREKFKKDLFKHYGISNNPKREIAWDYAWNHHSSGIQSVAEIMGEIISLIE